MKFPRKAAKVPGSFDRTVTLEDTLRIVPALRARYGITRVAETTHLDRIGIPTYSAMVPKSPDLLGVYNGKGMTRAAAIASAVCEAAERQIGANVQLPARDVDLDDVRAHIDLAALGVKEERGGPVACVDGFDVLAERVVPVPLALVKCPWFGAPLTSVVSTNGLASGNTLLEAAFHALCEIFERHVWSMHHIRSVWLPRLYRGMDAAENPVCAEVTPPTGDARIDALVDRIVNAEMHVRLFMHAEPNLPPAALAHVWESDGEPPMSHVGMGYGLSPTHALVRALTEAVQSRATDIQGAREDILRSDDPRSRTGVHTRRQASLPTGRWFFDGIAKAETLLHVDDRASDDLADDWHSLLQCARVAGFAPVLVDITPPGETLHVVRALVPGAEAVMIGFPIGQRGRALFNPFGSSPITGGGPRKQESA